MTLKKFWERLGSGLLLQVILIWNYITAYPRSMKKQPAKPPKRDSDAWLSDARKLGNAVRTSFLRVISQYMRASGEPCDFSDTAAQRVFDLSLQRGEVVKVGEWNGVGIYRAL